MTRRRWLILGVVVVLALPAGLAVAWHLAKQPAADIHNGASAFLDPPATTQTETTAPVATDKKQPFQGEPPWPMYGYNVARTRDASTFRQIKPPFHTVWKRKTFGILEYASFADGTLYLATDKRFMQAIDARTGDPVWTRRLGAGLANEAALSKTMYVGSHDGHVYALSRKTGKIIWKTKVGSEVECSQLYYRGRVYSGSHSGQVRSMDAKTGHILWTFQANGEVKSGLSTADGRLYFGDYSSTMYALRISSGKLLWRTHTAGLSSGYRSGSFYSTPSAAYGRVYIGNTDGKLYSFVASNGQIAWTHSFGSWVYGSPAVHNGLVFETGYAGVVEALRRAPATCSGGTRCRTTPPRRRP